MSSALKKIGSKFFVYIILFVLIFSLIILFTLGVQTKKLSTAINNSFYDFSNDVNEVSEQIVNDNIDSYIERYVDIETNAFLYMVKQMQNELTFLSDSLKIRYDDYNHNKDYYLRIADENIYKQNIENQNNREIKLFFQPNIDKTDETVKRDFGILKDYSDDLLLTIKDTLQAKNCFILTESGVSIFATDYDYNNSPKYAGEELDYKSEDWYKRTIATTSILFEGAYKDALSNKDIIAVQKSIISNGVVEGIIVIEVYIESLSVNNITLVPPDGINLFIADNSGEILYNAKADLFDNNIASEGTIKQFLKDTKELNSGKGSYIYDGNEYRCFYSKVSGTQFTLYVSIRENRLQESIAKLQKLVEDKNVLLHKEILKTSSNLFISVLLFVIFIIIILVIVAKKVSKIFEIPINELSSILSEARKIQNEMLPDDFNKISNRRDIEIYAKNIPELEVGGDFYNYIVRDNKLYLIIADVSGSGIPAALFMAKTNVLLSSAIKLSESPQVILSYVNAELCKNNKECYFVTIGLYCIDLKTRKVVFANSGHEDSIIIKNDNNVILKEEVRSAPLGLDEYNNFVEDEFVLEEGDVLFLYTDGVVEAINAKNELFGTERLISSLKSLGATDTKSIVNEMEQKLNDYSKGLEQYDDITMLCFKFKNIEIDKNKIFKFNKSFKAVYESIDEINEYIEECLSNTYDENTIYKKYLSQLNVCIEEVTVNICDYAYDKVNDANNDLNVNITIDKNVDKIVISFIDKGIEFDPTKKSDVNILQGINERNIGGFGIHIIKNVVDIFEYSRENDMNIFSLTKYL